MSLSKQVNEKDMVGVRIAIQRLNKRLDTIADTEHNSLTLTSAIAATSANISSGMAVSSQLVVGGGDISSYQIRLINNSSDDSGASFMASDAWGNIHVDSNSYYDGASWQPFNSDYGMVDVRAGINTSISNVETFEVGFVSAQTAPFTTSPRDNVGLLLKRLDAEEGAWITLGRATGFEPSTYLHIVGKHVSGLGMVKLDSDDHAYFVCAAASTYESGILLTEDDSNRWQIRNNPADNNNFDIRSRVAGDVVRFQITQAGTVIVPHTLTAQSSFSAISATVSSIASLSAQVDNGAISALATGSAAISIFSFTSAVGIWVTASGMSVASATVSALTVASGVASVWTVSKGHTSSFSAISATVSAIVVNSINAAGAIGAGGSISAASFTASGSATIFGRVSIATTAAAARLHVKDNGITQTVIHSEQDDDNSWGLVIGNAGVDTLEYRGLRMKSVGNDYGLIENYQGGAYRDVAVCPNGGNIRMGTKAGNSELAFDSYLTIKDKAGNTIKLAVVVTV